MELQRAQKQIEAWRKYATESSIGHTLAQVKEIIWNNIIEAMDEISPCIQIIFELKEFIERANQAISTNNNELGDMPATTNNIIKFLNSKNIYELDDLGVDDRTKTILELKKVLTKKNLIVQLIKKRHSLEIAVNIIFTKIEALTKRCLPSLFVINEKLMTKEYYMKKLKYIS